MSRLKLLLTRSPRAYAALRRGAVVGRYVARRPHEPDFAGFKRFDREGIFLDVGANSGQSALSFRIYNRRTPIVSIEPLPQHRRDLDLVKRLIPRFDYLTFAAGAEAGEANLRVPMYGEVALTGEATLSDEEGESAWSLEQLGAGADEELTFSEVQVAVRPLDDLGLAPAYVKIDVEGFEKPVLTGLERTLREYLPVLLIERSSADAEVRSHLEAMGYLTLSYDAATETFARMPERHTLNAFYVHRDSADLPREVSG